jgi:carbon storage regulator
LLILDRKLDQSIMVGDGIEIMVVRIKSDRVCIGIEAPKDIPVHRREIWDRIQRQKQGGTLGTFTTPDV